jgi:hypothetical protein
VPRLQREFDVVPVVGDGAAEALLGACARGTTPGPWFVTSDQWKKTAYGLTLS